MKIGPKTIQAAKDLVSELMDSYQKDIDTAYLKTDEGALSVSIGLKFSPDKLKENHIDVEASISFTAERIKNKIGKSVSESQVSMFPAAEKVYTLGGRNE